jgi:hypothetical protein
MRHSLPLIAAFGAANLIAQPALAEAPKSPAERFNIHVIAPHRHEDSTVHGPYHHYCKSQLAGAKRIEAVLKPEAAAALTELRQRTGRTYSAIIEGLLLAGRARDVRRAG